MEVAVRLFILISVFATSGCNRIANDQWGRQDKAQHFTASAVFAAAGNEYAQHQGNSRGHSVVTGLMFSVSLGTSKELWDSRPAGSGWS